MARANHIPTPAVKRLSLYLRQLEVLHAADRTTVSSRELGAALGLSDAQVRKDLAYFGQFGHPGIGYRVVELIRRVRRILGTEKTSHVLLVGAGKLGRALLAYRGFSRRGFEVVAVFDGDPRKIGQKIVRGNGLTIRPLSEMPETVESGAIRTGILAVPAPVAQAVADEMIAAGIRGILNFAPTVLRAVPGISVSSVDLAVHLEQLSFQVGATL